jgi:hypothetical protein
MSKFYNEELYESIEHPNFFDAEQLQFIKNGYQDLFDKVLAQITYDSNNEYVRIEEANFTRSPINKRLNWGQIGASVRDKESHDSKRFKQLSFQRNQPGFEFVDNLNDWTSTIIGIMEKRFEEIGRPAKVMDIAFHNFSQGLRIHCDGQDILTKLKNSVPRPAHHPNYAIEEYAPKEGGAKHAHQGLVNLDAQPGKATIIFDQWFPYSTYYDITNDLDNLDEAKRPVITFAKGDEFELFGEHIRELTGKPFNRRTWMQFIAPEFHLQFPPEMFHGLTLNKVLDFGEPGQLISWDNKRYHMAKPFTLWGNHGIGQEDRLMLQYESLCL